MQALIGWIVHVYAALAVVPFIPFFIIWIALYFVYKNKKKAMNISMDMTTLLLVGSVTAMFNDIFKSGFGFWLILLFFLTAFGLLGGLQNRLKGRLDVKKLVKALWRFGFLALSALYVLFLFIGLGKYIYSM